jgi:hypothetical protein
MRGGKREGAGRPPGTTSRKDTRNVVKQVRWTEAEWQKVYRAAKLAGVEPSVFIRRTTLDACELI